ncbi:histidine kinase [Nguyenibacter sp. L1]|uniref:sensor histidine kinase n=1 Tax=Nguyenibacter sp. L1 TaxID=3049350 RepID=UPI002B473964|nr:histidine kinase [Nguyenibacter sp. L1]WRH89458.1 histidine kinase [Nguyenibacter sp. L1]
MTTPTPSVARRHAGRLIWLAYLALYPLPYLAVRPSRTAILAGLLGLAAFLPLYLHAITTRRGTVLPQALAMAAIGFVLSPFGGIWSVYTIYAVSLAARLHPIRRAHVAAAGLLAAFLAFCAIRHADLINTLWGLLVGAMTAVGTSQALDIERRNRRLLDTQAEVRRLAALAERERIARDLHDLLGQSLTVIAIKADLGARLSATDPDRARDECRAVAQTARAALAEVRQAVTGMRDGGLTAELERARTALLAAGITLDAPAPAPADPRRQAVLAMVMREAVTNIIRHADARTCRIALTTDATGSLCLHIADDGTGGPLTDGAGIAGMRARMAAAGGSLTLSSDGSGTRLLARLPELAHDSRRDDHP